MNGTREVRDDTHRYVFVERARCPVCNSADLRTTRSTAQGDGTTARRTQCRECSARFIVVVE